MGLDTYATILDLVLRRAQMGTSSSTEDWYGTVEDALIEAWRDLVVRHPWLSLRKDPPGAFVTTNDITTTTITIATAGTGVTVTLSASPATSIAGRKIAPTGKSWISRVTAHTVGSTSATVDAAPETLAAGTACVIYQDEYDLASDLGAFVDGLWSDDGFVPPWPEDRVRADYPDPPSAARIPRAFCRIGQRRIRLSHYPTEAIRFEYPYSYEPADPSGSGTLAIAFYLRPAYAELGLALAFGMKSDRREANAQARAEVLIRRALAYEDRLRSALLPGASRQMPEADYA